MNRKIIRSISLCLVIIMLSSVTVGAKSLKEILGTENPSIEQVESKLDELTSYTKSKLKDIKGNEWFATNLVILYSMKGVDGYNDGTFKPKGTITVAEFLKMLLAAVGNKQEIPPAPAKWYDNYVKAAKEEGIVQPSDRYNYSQAIKRDEMAKIISLLLDEVSQPSPTPIFTDTRNGYVEQMFKNYIIRGYYANKTRTFKPKNPMTRAEATEVVVRVIKYIADPQGFKEEMEAYYKELEAMQDGRDGYLSSKALAQLKTYKDDQDAENAQMGFYTSNEEFIKEFGISDAQKMMQIAKGYMETYNNKDYRTIGENFRNQMREYRSRVDYEAIEEAIQRAKDYKIIVEGKFMTDPSLVYLSSNGRVRIRGTLRYIVHSCTDVEEIYGEGIVLGKWVEEDVEVELFTNGLGYYLAQTIWISGEPRYIGG